MGGALTYRVKSNEYFIPMEGSVNVENEIEKLSNELTYTEGFLKSIQAKLTNERFVKNAPEKVVASEKQKEADALAKITTLKNSLSSLTK
jgi:valyl-tRNA synthetase